MRFCRVAVTADLAGGFGDVDDQRAFPALKCLVDSQKLVVGVNPTSANTPGMPGYRGYENSMAMWGSIVAVALIFMSYGWLIGLLSLPLGIVVFLIAGRIVQKRAGRRTQWWALSSASRFRAMWDAGVVSVRDTQSGRTAISARGDNLEEFVRAAVDEVFRAQDHPTAKKLEAAFAGLVSEPQGASPQPPQRNPPVPSSACGANPNEATGQAGDSGVAR